MQDFITIKEAAEKWNITARRIQVLCSEGRIEGAVKFGRDWAIPVDATKPEDLPFFSSANYQFVPHSKDYAQD